MVIPNKGCKFRKSVNETENRSSTFESLLQLPKLDLNSAPNWCCESYTWQAPPVTCTQFFVACNRNQQQFVHMYYVYNQIVLIILYYGIHVFKKTLCNLFSEKTNCATSLIHATPGFRTQILVIFGRPVRHRSRRFQVKITRATQLCLGKTSRCRGHGDFP